MRAHRDISSSGSYGTKPHPYRCLTWGLVRGTAEELDPGSPKFEGKLRKRHWGLGFLVS